MSDGNSQWLTLKESAERLGVHPETMKVFLRDAGVKVLRMKGSYRIRSGDLDQVISESLTTIGGERDESD